VFHETLLGDETFARLVAVDEKLVAVKQALGCPHCGGRLGRAGERTHPVRLPEPYADLGGSGLSRAQ